MLSDFWTTRDMLELPALTTTLLWSEFVNDNSWHQASKANHTRCISQNNCISIKVIADNQQQKKDVVACHKNVE